MEENREITTNTDAEVKSEKTYTQAEVDNIVKGRLARERSKAKSEERQKPTPEEIDEMISSDRKWFEENVGGSFEEFLHNEEFEDFMNENPLTIRKGMEKFVKLKGKDSFKKSPKVHTASTGSVKDSGASNLKEYYSPDDVDKLSDKDLDNPEIIKRIRQSMTKWK